MEGVSEEVAVVAAWPTGEGYSLPLEGKTMGFEGVRLEQYWGYGHDCDVIGYEKGSVVESY